MDDDITASAPTSTPTTTSVTAPTTTSASAPTTPPLKVAVILGSNREGRFGHVVADWLLAHTDGRSDIDTELVDLAEVDLPVALSFQPTAGVRDELAKVSPVLAAADAFVVITPEYNHSYPASLKSLIDWHRAEWQAKPVGFVSYGGVSGGLRAVEHLRTVFAELHTVGIRDTVSFHSAAAQFDDNGRHLDPADCDAAAKTLLDQLVWWGQALREAKAARPYGS
ncbi:NADPH-dependent FMN reductase [Streptomyces sp. DT24]|uniref:NADPH-dependent FMN reductase n=1 Tax=unclassified Streptomyces TaxID=2593676 RepID=UPI003CED108F